jgi:molybdopterin converting factor small subunit
MESWETALTFHVGISSFVIKNRTIGNNRKQGTGTMASIELRLFASLAPRTPPDAMRYDIGMGLSIAQLLEKLGVAHAEAKLIFVDSARADVTTKLLGGERVGIFPPVGGG